MRSRQFYHGGAAQLEPGDLVLPSRYTGQPNTGNGTGYAWASTNPKTAADYASYARSDSGEGHVYRVRVIDGDSPSPDDAGRATRGEDHGRETGWLVEGHAWDTGQQNWDRINRVRQGNDRMNAIRQRRATRQRAYDRDNRLNSQEREVADRTLDEISPAHAEKSRQFREIMSLLG